MTIRARGGHRSAASIWRPARGTAAVLMVLCGGWIALTGLGLRERFSGHLWSSNCYYLDWCVGTLVIWVVAFFVLMSVGLATSGR